MALLTVVLVWSLSPAIANAETVDGADDPALAEEGGADAEGEALPWYEVEVIVFRQWERGGRDRERWPSGVRDPHYPLWQVPAGCNGALSSATTPVREPDVEEPRAVAAAEIARESAANPEAAEEAWEMPVFECLPGEALQMRGIWDALRRSGDYRAVYHLGWRQPGLDEEHSIAVPVPVYWQPPPVEEIMGLVPAPPRLQPEVYGLIRLYRERFLHAVVDLRFLRTGSGAEVEIEEMLRAPVHEMRQSRRMRSSERHYLDHPALGVIIEVRFIEKDETSED